MFLTNYNCTKNIKKCNSLFLIVGVSFIQTEKHLRKKFLLIAEEVDESLSEWEDW